ncbi:MAG: HAD family hydrolase [Clostridiaceae bacterium]|nr:HAD family hydrolase [Clostridiaceae bacterium]
MNYKAVIFDLDGTLLDSIEDLADSMNTVLEEAGYPAHDIETYKYYVGNGMKNLVLQSLPESHKDSRSVEHFIQRMQEEYSRRWNKKTRPYDGIPELLDKLREKNIQVAVLSNKPDKFTKLIVKELLSSWHFSAVYGDREGIPKKPDPGGALEIAGMLGLQPKNILYLGDTGVDMQTANNAGMFAVGALWGFRKKEEILSNGAAALISNPLDLLSFF